MMVMLGIKIKLQEHWSSWCTFIYTILILRINIKTREFDLYSQPHTVYFVRIWKIFILFVWMDAFFKFPFPNRRHKKKCSVHLILIFSLNLMSFLIKIFFFIRPITKPSKELPDSLTHSVKVQLNWCVFFTFLARTPPFCFKFQTEQLFYLKESN